MAKTIKNVVTPKGVYVHQGIRVFPASSGKSAQVPDSAELRKLLSSGVLIEVPKSNIGAEIKPKTEQKEAVKIEQEAAAKKAEEQKAKDAAKAEQDKKEQADTKKPSL